MMSKREIRLRKSAIIISVLALLSGCGHDSVSSIEAAPGFAQPRVVQTGGSPTNWETFITPASGAFNFDSLSTVGPDRQIWLSSGGNVFRFHVTTGEVDTFSGFETGFGLITPGPDGNIWICGF